MKIKYSFVVAFVSFIAFFVLFTNKTQAVSVEQDDCAPGFIVNSDETACIPVNAQNDPEGCYAAGGGADAIERCLAASSRPCELSSNFLGIPTWYKYLNAEADSTGRCTPLIERDEEGRLNVNSLLPIGVAVLEGLLRLAGLIAVAMVIIGSFRFITSQGNPENAASARKTIINALIGLVIVILSTTVVNFIGNSLT